MMIIVIMTTLIPAVSNTETAVNYGTTAKGLYHLQIAGTECCDHLTDSFLFLLTSLRNSVDKIYEEKATCWSLTDPRRDPTYCQ